MNRITQYFGSTISYKPGCEYSAFEKLAAYEDTGLEPEEVMELVEAMARKAEDE